MTKDKGKDEKKTKLWHPVHGVKDVVKSRIQAYLGSGFVLASSRASLQK